MNFNMPKIGFNPPAQPGTYTGMPTAQPAASGPTFTPPGAANPQVSPQRAQIAALMGPRPMQAPMGMGRPVMR